MTSVYMSPRASFSKIAADRLLHNHPSTAMLNKMTGEYRVPWDEINIHVGDGKILVTLGSGSSGVVTTIHSGPVRSGDQLCLRGLTGTIGVDLTG